jgi:hypothetical protein
LKYLPPLMNNEDVSTQYMSLLRGRENQSIQMRIDDNHSLI